MRTHWQWQITDTTGHAWNIRAEYNFGRREFVGEAWVPGDVQGTWFANTLT